MAGTPVTQDDLDSVKDVPIEVAISYLKALEHERRGLLKTGEVLRALQSAIVDRAEAERKCEAAERDRRIAEAALEDLTTRVADEQTRLDRLRTEVGEAQQNLTDEYQAADNLKIQLEQDLIERRVGADGAHAEVERQHRERRAELLAEEQELAARIQALRDELKGLAAKAGAL